MPDPADQILQGMQSFAEIAPLDSQPGYDVMTVLQGETPIGQPTGDAVPRAMIGWLPYFAVPSSIGPMDMQGTVKMVPIGPAVAATPLIDPTQKFLNARLPLDATGTLQTVDDVLGYPAPDMSWLLSANADMPLAAIPRAEIVQSGLLKIVTAATLSGDFGQKIYETQQTYQVFQLDGTTVNGSGAPVPGCRVIAYQSGWRAVADLPVIIAETVSDGAGAFSLLLRNIDYQLTAYIEGSPDLAGITRQDVTPVVQTTIYLRDPTAPDVGGSGGFVGAPVHPYVQTWRLV